MPPLLGNFSKFARDYYSSMQLTELFLQNFRNYEKIEIELKPGITGISGYNGHGKTNFLEAIHLITQGYSHRTRKVPDLLKWNTDMMVLRAQGESKKSLQKSALTLDKRGAKQVKLNSQNYKVFTKLLGSYGTLNIGPADIQLIQEGPGERRKYLDALGSQFSATYLDVLRKYTQMTKQRNAFLKSTSSSQNDLWESISQTFVQYGTQLIIQRLKLLGQLKENILDSYETISSGAEELSFEFQSSIGVSYPIKATYSEDEIKQLETEIFQTFWNKLLDRKVRERDAKMSLYGPHKDDLIFLLKSKSLREFGSQGQQRSTALALKLAAAHKLELEFGAPPILLLDDIFSELDQSRRKALAKRIQSSHQVFVASPEQQDLPFQTTQQLNVHDGNIFYA